MAPPASRRTGYSRKAQYSVFTGYLLAALGAVLGLVLLGLSWVRPHAFAPLRGMVSSISAPAGEASAVTRSGTQSVWSTVTGFWQAGSQNAGLREELEIARIRIAEADAVAAENARLKDLLGLAKDEVKPVAVTRLVGSSAASARRYAYLSIGRRQGLTPGMPVVSDKGVIGRVLEVTRSASRVLLLTDTESVLPVRRAGDDVVAFAEGRGDGLLKIKLINLGLNPLKKGDLMVTSGAGGYFRPGVAVAVVTELTSDGALARLVAEPSATNFVTVEPIYEAVAVAAAQTPPERELADPAAGE
ncbi:MAG: rod shape-determining protein MreC [Erythrobacter sp. SCN 62-14]|nr:MAG: rod shape-determining protein MreC [Erythrobacter sp. SCN 62-14]